MYKIILILLIFLTSCENLRNKERTYCGTVIDKGKEEPTSGYKSSSDAKYFVVMKTDSCNQIIRVNVTVPTYYKLENNSSVCFDLDGWDLYGGGNITDPSDTLKCN